MYYPKLIAHLLLFWLFTFPLLSKAKAEIIQGLSGSITTRGSVYVGTCDFNIFSYYQDFDLGFINSSMLNNVGDQDGITPISIHLSKCSDNSSFENINIKFDGIKNDSDGLILENHGSAKGIGLRVLDIHENIISDLNGYNQEPNKVISFYVLIERDANNKVEGSIYISTRFIVSYE